MKPDGKIIVGFRSDVFVVPNLQMINNGTIFLSDLQGYGRELRLRPDDIPVLQVEVIPGIESNATELSFVWNVTKQE